MYTFFFFNQFQKMYKRFFNPSSGRDKGTIYHMKVLVQRSNVNGKVKSWFEVSYKQNINKLYLLITTPIVFSIQAHEDFILTAGCAYFLSYILQYFGMKSITDEPQHPLLKKNMKMMHNSKKGRNFFSDAWRNNWQVDVDIPRKGMHMQNVYNGWFNAYTWCILTSK